MSMLAMATSNPNHPFRRDFSWENGRSPDLITSRPRQDSEKIALPSIRQAFPELQLRLLPQDARSAPPTASPSIRTQGTLTPPEYVHSHSPNSNKRRRLSIGEEKDSQRANRVPRLYASPGRSGHDQVIRAPSPAAPVRPAIETWSFSAAASPPLGPGGLPSMRSPTAMEVSERSDSRPSLPSLPFMRPERVADSNNRPRGHSSDGYLHDIPRTPFSSNPSDPRLEAGVGAYRQSGYTYGHHPSRSVGSVHAYDRSQYPPRSYGAHYPEYVRVGEVGSMGVNGDNKQRKRRGNLPKETTDKLRAWFAAHLSHPYPTEEEKHELMRQTGLQMNQISNWFINARRRQLPGMLNNSRVEPDVMVSSRSMDGRVLPSTERTDYDVDGKRASPLSDGTDSAFGEDLDHLGRRRVKRGSV